MVYTLETVLNFILSLGSFCYDLNSDPDSAVHCNADPYYQDNADPYRNTNAVWEFC